MNCFKKKKQLVKKKNMSDLAVLITVPHAACGFDLPTRRTCDKVAFKCASVLKEQFESEDIMPRFYANTTTDRSKVDMNRIGSRRTKFRISISKEMASFPKKQPIYVYDIHSFPKGNPETSEFAMYLLPHQISLKKSNELAAFISKDTGLNIGVLLGTLDNDITLEALNTLPDAIPFLIETSEELNVATITSAMKSIVKWTLLDARQHANE